MRRSLQTTPPTMYDPRSLIYISLDNQTLALDSQTLAEPPFPATSEATLNFYLCRGGCELGGTLHEKWGYYNKKRLINHVVQCLYKPELLVPRVVCLLVLQPLNQSTGI